ncbi:hypothetical protein BpHYR1_019529 [Brachionus plicatilis]|uniref:Uncharacterized protein n=1 Tax=Brachionus plicatilis TaxID=10195 RepID=A0A3M7PV47_BRAPC|nr:hypothetical protein BpHYR1_019529 [Brachionus plicatilis]
MTVKFYYLRVNVFVQCASKDPSKDIVPDPSSMKVSINNENHNQTEPKTGICSDTKEILHIQTFLKVLRRDC